MYKDPSCSVGTFCLTLDQYNYFSVHNFFSPQRVNNTIDSQLQQAKAQNAEIDQIMGSMGVNPRPTVSMWLEQKNKQKKAVMQEALIDWDR